VVAIPGIKDGYQFGWMGMRASAKKFGKYCAKSV